MTPALALVTSRRGRSRERGVLAAPKDGWNRERRALLDGYRRDKADGVAGPAGFVFPPE